MSTNDVICIDIYQQSCMLCKQMRKLSARARECIPFHFQIIPIRLYEKCIIL